MHSDAVEQAEITEADADLAEHAALDLPPDMPEFEAEFDAEQVAQSVDAEQAEPALAAPGFPDMAALIAESLQGRDFEKELPAEPQANASAMADEPVEAIAEADLEADEAEAEAETADIGEVAADPIPQAEAAEAQTPVVPEKLQRARARVIKIRRADAPAHLDGKAPAASALTPEAEADLQAELAALEAEAGGIVTAQAPQGDPADASGASHEAAEVFAAVPSAKTTDESVDRLIAQANTALEVPETKRRQSAIAHLKAAVAATLAERHANPRSDATGAARRMDPYRQDLDQVVRPINPARPDTVASASAGATPPQPGRLAPLVLVSAQRIDRPRPATVAAEPAVPSIPRPVRPRRVTTGGLAIGGLAMQASPPAMDDDEDDDAALSAGAPDNIFAERHATSFSDFAKRLGVSEMADLLEAAGAYCAVFQGCDQFSRPMLLRHIEALPGTETRDREDGLRGFGRLLRDGRITKARRGQFQLAEGSHVLSEARRIAG